MATKILVVEVDQITTRVIEMDYMSRNPVVHGFFTFPTPLETTRDGAVKPNEDFVMTFKNQYAFHNMTAQQVVFLLSSSRITSRDVEIPAVPDKQIQGVLEGSFTDYFPVDPEQYHFVYKILRRKNDEPTKTIELNLLAIPNDLTAGYFELSHALELQLLNICFVGNSSVLLNKVMNGESLYVSPIMKSLSPILSKFNFKPKKKQEELASVPDIQDDGALILGTDELDNQTPVSAVVKLEAYSSFVTIVNGGESVMQRAILNGYNELLETVRSSNMFGDDITQADAINVLHENSLLYSTFLDSRKPDESRYGNLKTELTECLKVLIGTVSRVLDYYTSRNQNTYVKKIILTGSGAYISGLSRLFQNEMGFEVITVEEFPHLTFAGEKKKKEKKEPSEPKANAPVDVPPEPKETVVSLDQLSNMFSSPTAPETPQKEEPEADGTEMARLPDAPVIEKFNPSVFALLIVSGLTDDGIVTEAERFGDQQAANARKEKKIVAICSVASAVLLLGAAGLAGYSIYQYNQALDKKAEVEKNIAQYEAQNVEGVYFQYVSEQNKTASLKDILAATHSPNENLVAFIEELEEKIPTDTVVESLIATEQGITLNFVSTNKVSAAKMLTQLRTFESIELVSSASLTDSDSFIERNPDGRMVSYAVSLVYKNIPYDVDAFLEQEMSDAETTQEVNGNENN